MQTAEKISHVQLMQQNIGDDTVVESLWVFERSQISRKVNGAGEIFL